MQKISAWLAGKHGNKTKDEFKRMQQFTVRNHIPGGALLSDDHNLKGVSLIRFHWMYCYMSAGSSPVSRTVPRIGADRNACSTPAALA